MAERALEPATEILVLSFSVAAAHEIRSRLLQAVKTERYDDDLLFVTIRTFDSFASHYMYQLQPDVDLSELDYDQRIARAIDIIREDETAQTRLQHLRHIMIDEVQDLVGLRANFSLAILQNHTGGYTLFGDPAQAVYNFMLAESNTEMTSDRFLQEVGRIPGSPPRQLYLEENFRAEGSSELRKLANEGRHLLTCENAERAYNFLRRALADLPSVGSMQEINLPNKICDAHTAFLCRTNGQALFLAKRLRENKISFTLQKPLESIEIPAWVGTIFYNWDSQLVRKRDFVNAMTSLRNRNANAPDAEDTWTELQSATHSRTSIRVTAMRRALVEDGLFMTREMSKITNAPVISTVHRAKGREYQDVILLMRGKCHPEEYIDEARVLFVGLTRAKKNLFRLSEKGTKGIRKLHDRWVRTSWENGNERLTAFEVGHPLDIERHSSVSLSMFENDPTEISENQQFLRESIKHGADVRLDYYRTVEGLPVFFVKIREEEGWLAVGHTSCRFGISLRSCLEEINGARPKSWPHRIEGLWVSKVVTEIGNLANEDVPREYRNTGLWLGARVEGLGVCKDWGRI